MAAEERVLRLRKQKRMWFEKMMRAIARGIDSVEELERVEREEAAAAVAAEASGVTASSSTPSRLSADFGQLWDAVYPEVPLDPSLLADFGLVSGSSLSVGQGSSGGTAEVSRGNSGS
ncbi:hypothetical protein MYCTH_2313167 [Thermothelomyces thermophilus ATCC 42464]|uniref:Uncharacterized protein n=1 Tax=Thermothelomyces thermophilus (strain ATCC 42464 / BCRC 31852 / DSM 1799) TaxID=573729 RepID=G2QNW7_THET4|nr:uncharacterized protein MYCTH_2297841 [Thermothelomyces thermophilus ATCC 42464]XP_003665547.1 uncharacterized protein MYCTH_2309423 [Thermothelomyces thermophilus ATCC 42464]XP_003666098.1 uncharacterized protein MYCTH_2310527 [Thermothelomyces thermophilus ATCC 42464]XP_003667388.1 uncharacterized protein MYCTH_2313167 [Thermothelomyces thermophilus ATCC 42464]AEO54806.1 hypothetical protein MYCTH_2297841 [Thermothelomyces thermophilus ATCC 42464]AEO60302.1 hypothetical protein MYCTH_2309